MRSKWLVGLMVGMVVLTLAVMSFPVGAQEAANAEVRIGQEQAAEDVDPDVRGFFQVVAASGTLGVLLWLVLLACSIAMVALVVDSFITIRQTKISPLYLEDTVQEAMEQGDVMKALNACEEEISPLANILSAGFSNVQEGFEAIQDAVGVAADMESEKLLQRVAYLNVVGNLAPMLGLLGTVQGMIFAFATLALHEVGGAQTTMLAMNISQALYTTAAGLSIAVPAVGFFFYFRNKATRIILGMEAMTMDLIKSLRNVEVVEE